MKPLTPSRDGDLDTKITSSMSDKEAEDAMYKAIKHWNLMDKMVANDSKKQDDNTKEQEHVGNRKFEIGERVLLHAAMWNKIKDGFRMWDVPFKDKVQKFYMCIGWIVSSENESQSTVRFYLRSSEHQQTLGVDFQVPNFIIKKAPRSIKFQTLDFAVIVDTALKKANTYTVLECGSGNQLKLRQFQTAIKVSVDQTEAIILPVYNAEEPWVVEIDNRRTAAPPNNPLVEKSNKRRMTQLIFGCKGEKLNSQMALETLTKLNNDRNGILFTQVCIKDEDFVNTVIDDKVPLVVAIEMNSPFLINILIACGADKDVMDRRGNTLLHLAAATGSIHTVQTILYYIPEVINTPNLAGDTPFHVLCKAKHYKLLEKFLEIPEVDVTFRDSTGNTGFHSLIKMEEDDPIRIKCLSLFMRPGPWLTATNGENMVPLHAAIAWKKEMAVNMFLDNMSFGDRPIGSPDTDLSLAQVAAKIGNYNIFHRIASGCNGSFMETSTKKNVMHFAVEGWSRNESEDYQRCRIVQFLLARQDAVRLNQADLFENTAVHLLARVVNEFDRKTPYENKIFDSLVSSKDQGLMALMNASEGNYPLATLCFFSTCGADFWHVNADGFTPLDLLERENLRVLMADCSRAGVNSWTQMPTRKNVTTPETRNCFRCKKQMDPNNVVYCLPCQHYFACADCRQHIARMDRCMICSSEIEAIRALCDGNDELLHGEVAPQCTEDGRKVTDVLDELKNKITALEDSILCEICMEEQCKVVFNCGHTACRNCSSENILKDCHMCRQPIIKRVTIF
ncbi:unnamed protein product [Bursaphelenchus xylophilus]|uniref:(pine wood nematode) hypothetical protein n=1 Tax=Bursaphelenchus xylophilus TaxID=6326 RepID=A0A1I7RSP7_BURXY|nr:unnamed protein product [Bursaphelenchus xylophilus]CAG9122844.1 unnamed protein product [Bursaphelenchus xylophilus]